MKKTRVKILPMPFGKYTYRQPKDNLNDTSIVRKKDLNVKKKGGVGGKTAFRKIKAIDDDRRELQSVIGEFVRKGLGSYPRIIRG